MAACCGPGYSDASTRITYNSEIRVCEVCEKWEAALATVREMRGAWVAPDVVTYNSAIGASKRSRRWVQPLALLGEMRGRGLLLDAVARSLTLMLAEQRGMAATEATLLGLLGLR